MTRDPLVLLAGLGLVSTAGFGLYLAGMPLHYAQQVTAAGCVLLWLAAVILAPANGLVLLYLVPPFFNGEDGRPYFFLLELLVYLTILAGVATRAWRRWPPAGPGAMLAALVLLSAVLSFPLNLAELRLEFSVTSWREILEDLRRSDLAGNFFYFRTILNVASGVALYALAAGERWSRETLVRLATATTLVYLAVSLLGLWHYWLPVRPGKFMTVAYGWTGMQGGFVGLGFNMSYFGQYALAYLPLSALLLVERTSRWVKCAALLALTLTPYTILSTGQKGAYIVFAVELVLLLWVGLVVSRAAGPRVRVVLAAVVSSLLLVGSALLLLTRLGSVVADRFHLLVVLGDTYRVQALTAAWQMLRDHPVLGAGAGRYAGEFPSYNPEPTFQVGSLSAHNLYAQFLAEQGLLGLGAFLALVAVTVVPILRARSWLRMEGPGVLFLLVSLGAWLTYGFLQYTFLMRSMQVYFWITLGLVAALTPHPLPLPRVPRRWVVAGLGVLLVLVGLRAHAALTRPLPAGLAVGVYAPEGGARWTRSGAAFVVPVQGRVLRLSVSTPLVAVGGPQTVDISLDGVPVKRLTLETPNGGVAEIPVDRPRGSQVVLRLRTSYTIVLAKRGLGEDQRPLGVQVWPVQWAGG